MPSFRSRPGDSPRLAPLPRRTIAALLGCLLIGACSHPKPAAETLYLSDERGDAVVALNPASGTIVGRYSPGRRPRGVVLSHDGAQLYVAVSGSPIGGPDVDEQTLPPADHSADGIAVIDLASGKVARVLPAGHDPETFALSPDGRTLFVSNEGDGLVSAVAVNGGRAPISAKVGDEPEGVAVTPDGARLFVACEASDHVAMLDARTLRPIKTIPIAGRPRALLMSHDGGTLYASVESAGKLAMISATDGTVIALIDLASGDKSVKPMGMVEAPDGHLFVTTGRGGTVIEINPKAREIVRTIRHVGKRPWGIGITADGRTLVTANGPSGDTSMIDRASGKIVRKIGIGKSPWGVAGHIVTGS